LGGPLDAESRPKFSEIFRGLTEKVFPVALYDTYKIPEEFHVPNLTKPFIFQIPKQGTVFDYRYTKEVIY